jgi:hypothetical protein
MLAVDKRKKDRSASICFIFHRHFHFHFLIVGDGNISCQDYFLFPVPVLMAFIWLSVIEDVSPSGRAQPTGHQHTAQENIFFLILL